MRPDELRNLLILSGTERELKHLIDTIDMFDVDWMAGMSVGPVHAAERRREVGRPGARQGDRRPQPSPLAGILRIIPIERMNALLVITPQPAYLDEAKKWIERLDQGGGGDGPRFYVYNLQNQRAEKLGPLLQQAFTGRARSRPRRRPRRRVAPGTPAGHDRLAAARSSSSRPSATPTIQIVAAADARGGGRDRRARPRASASCATSRSSPTRTTTRC